MYGSTRGTFVPSGVGTRRSATRGCERTARCYCSGHGHRRLGPIGRRGRQTPRWLL